MRGALGLVRPAVPAVLGAALARARGSLALIAFTLRVNAASLTNWLCQIVPPGTRQTRCRAAERLEFLERLDFWK
jgi:hypothetical protein